MEEKKNLCAMIPTDLHRKIMAEKEQLELNTLAEYVERIFTEHFEGISGSPQPQAKAVPHPAHRECAG